MSTQVKFYVADELAERFKRAVVAKRGRLAMSEEGEEALRLYLSAARSEPTPPLGEPLLKAIGIVRSTRAGNALRDKQSLYDSG